LRQRSAAAEWPGCLLPKEGAWLRLGWEMSEADVLSANKRLLAAVGAGDYGTYEALSSQDLTCIEPETQGHIVEGLGFHKCTPLTRSHPCGRTTDSGVAPARSGTFSIFRNPSRRRRRPVHPLRTPWSRRWCACSVRTMPWSCTSASLSRAATSPRRTRRGCGSASAANGKISTFTALNCDRSEWACQSRSCGPLWERIGYTQLM
jgi:hypothetical protein